LYKIKKNHGARNQSLAIIHSSLGNKIQGYQMTAENLFGEFQNLSCCRIGEAISPGYKENGQGRM
jgi:hypothetical protein